MSRSTNDEPTRASIPGQRRGRARLEPLAPCEGDLYDWILAAFAAGTPPTPASLADAASTFGVDLERALATFAREDLVHHDVLVNPKVSGRAIPLPEAIELGRSIFGDLLPHEKA